MKGVLQTERGWVAFNLVPDGEIEARASSYRRDARLEILTSAGAARPAWAEVHQALLASFYGEHGDVATSLE